MAGVQKVRLNNLNPNLKNGLIVGIVIAKNSPRIIGSKKKNGESRGVTSFTLRDSDIDTINVDVWGSEYFVLTFYERFLVGDVVEITSPKICAKSGTNELYRPQVSSPFYLSLNEGFSDVSIHSGDTFGSYLPLLHIPTKPASGYYGLAEILKLPENDNVFVDLLVVVKSVKPAKSIKTKIGTDMSVRSVEIMDNTTPASLALDMFDIDTIQRAEDWRALESVLFIADAKVTWRGRAAKVQVCARTVITHQPHTADAEALQLYIRNQANAPGGGEAAAWAAWSGERACAASVAQIRDRLAKAVPFCASLHAVLTHLDLDDLVSPLYRAAGNCFTDGVELQYCNCNDYATIWKFLQGLRRQQSLTALKIEHNILSNGSTTPRPQMREINSEELNVRFTDHTGELNARLPINVLEEILGYSPEQLKKMSSEDRAAVRWKILLEQCTAKLAVAMSRLIVLTLRRATPADPIPLY